MKSPLHIFPTLERRFQHIHLYIMGPLLREGNYTYLLIIIVGFIHWPEVIPIKEITAPTVVETFIAPWVARVGMPTTIIIVCGLPFIYPQQSDLDDGIHQASNGMVECFQLKMTLTNAAFTGIHTPKHPIGCEAGPRLNCS